MSAFNMSFSEPKKMKATMKTTGGTDFKMGFTAGGKMYSNVAVNTTDGWNSQPNLVSVKNTVYVYSDYRHDEEGNSYPAFKVGDGLAYVIDLPFNDELMAVHIADSSIHITDEEREFWNNKVSVFVDSENEEHIIFTTD